jgi:hypothetical protein
MCSTDHALQELGITQPPQRRVTVKLRLDTTSEIIHDVGFYLPRSLLYGETPVRSHRTPKFSDI